MTISVDEEVLLRLCANGSITFREVIERLDLGRERANALRMRVNRLKAADTGASKIQTMTVTVPTITTATNHIHDTVKAPTAFIL